MPNQYSCIDYMKLAAQSSGDDDLMKLFHLDLNEYVIFLWGEHIYIRVML